MKDFTEFEAFHRCRDFARAVSKPILAGTFSRDPVLVYQLRKSLLSVYSNFAEGLNGTAIVSFRNSCRSPKDQ